MDSEILHLWKGRKQAFTKEIMPYLRYVWSSGFPAFLSLIGILSTIQYFKFIHNIPEGFPIELVAAIIFTPLVAYSPLRTWLNDADIIYIMPMEHRMKTYLKQSHIRSLRNGFIYLAIIVMLYWPVYIHASQYMPILLILLLTVLKLGNHYLAWKERQMAWSTERNLLRFFRWVITLLLIGGWLVAPLYLGTIVVTVILVSVLLLLYRLEERHNFPWQRLITEEKNSVRRIYSFLSWFIDVKTRAPIVKQRNYLGWLISLVPYGKKYAFVYLNMITFIRTEVCGICVRLLLLGGLVNYIAASTNGFGGWGVLFSQIVFGLLICLQIGTIRKIHQYAIWKNIFPLQPNLQHKQIITVDTILCYLLLVVLFTPTYPMWSLENMPVIMVTLLFTLGYPLFRKVTLKNKLAKEMEDDLD